MGVQDLQQFLASTGLEGGSVSVDLLKIARNVPLRQQAHQYSNRKNRTNGNKLKLIMDAECCLDRLYGGYFSDWACGGQWNRMVQFLSLLMQAIERGNIDIAIVINGTAEPQRLNEWIAQQSIVRQKVAMVLKHINTKGTPPPKIWWTPPTCLKTALRMALRHLTATVMCTMDDHHQEVIAYCREYGFHGLLGDDAEYATFDPPRYFSSQQVKLTYKGSLETKEYMLSELTKTLQLSNEQVCVVAALLGSFLLPESELQDVYRKITITSNKDIKGEAGVRAIAEYVRSLPPPSDMDAMVAKIFTNADDRRSELLRQAVQYYLNGTANGFLKYGNDTGKKNYKKKTSVTNNNINTSNTAKVDENNLLDTAVGFASETTEQEQESLENYKLATANAVISSDIEIGLNHHQNNNDNLKKTSPDWETSQLNGYSECGSSNLSDSVTNSTENVPKNSTTASSGSSIMSSLPTSPKHSNLSNQSSYTNGTKPLISTDVLRTASLRHQRGLMVPVIWHLLNTQELRLECLMEDEHSKEFPPIHEIYRQLRQHVYAILFNLHHHRFVFSKKKESGEVATTAQLPEIFVKEWVYSRTNPYQYPEIVKAEPLPWAVPTLHRLWFGPSLDDKRRRLRALLTCMNSDSTMILNTSFVPQHMLVMACVLRYIMSQPKPILRRQELDAFLCQAYSPDLMNAQYLQELTLNVVTSRGVQLAAMFMEGVDMVIIANDVCGAPLPWLMCCPWLYFDGKLFNHTLARSTQCKNLLELCENHVDRLIKVERMRKAILEGLDIQFAKIPLPPFPLRQGLPPPNSLPTISLPSTRGAAGLRQRPIPSRGGQLQIAGVVVGSWGANYGYQGPPQLNQGRGRGNNQYQRGGQHNQRKPGPPSFSVNKKSIPNKKKVRTPVPTPRGRGLTMKTINGDVLASDVLKENLTPGVEQLFVETEHQGQGDGPTQPVPAATH